MKIKNKQAFELSIAGIKLRKMVNETAKEAERFNKLFWKLSPPLRLEFINKEAFMFTCFAKDFNKAFKRLERIAK